MVSRFPAKSIVVDYCLTVYPAIEMFGFGASKESRSNFSTSTRNVINPFSLEPAIDGPPSPERIRAYTEQVKRSSVFGHRSKSDTNSSSTFSFQSNDSSNSLGYDNMPSRKSSVRSNASTMATRGERPESMQIFAKNIFSRTKKSNYRGSNNSSSSTLSSLGTTLGGIDEIPSARDIYYGKAKSSRKGASTDGNDSSM